MSNSRLLGRVLCKRPGFYRTFRAPDGQVAVVHDPGSADYIIAEAIALSATEIAFTPNAAALPDFHSATSILRDRVRVVDANRTVTQQKAAFVRPILTNLGFEQRDGGIVARPTRLPPLAPRVSSAFAYFHWALYDFLLGANSKAQIDIDLPRLQQAIAVLRDECSDREAVARLSVLQGIMGTYRTASAPSLFVPHADSTEQQRRFKYLIEDIAYRDLSEGVAFLGIPADFQRGMQIMHRALDAIMRSPILSWGVRATQRALATSQSLPAIDGDLRSLLIPNEYLPPIVSLEAAYSAALGRWSRTRLPAEATGHFSNLLRASFVELQGAPQPPMESIPMQEGIVRLFGNTEQL